jgi:hypothetical protein
MPYLQVVEGYPGGVGSAGLPRTTADYAQLSRSCPRVAEIAGSQIATRSPAPRSDIVATSGLSSSPGRLSAPNAHSGHVIGPLAEGFHPTAVASIEI